MLAEGAAADWSAVYLHGPLGAGAGVAALGFTAFSIAMTSARLVGDRLTLRAGAVRLVRGGALLATAGLGAALLIAEPPAAIAGFALLGAGVAVIVPSVCRAAGTARGVTPGTATTMGSGRPSFSTLALPFHTAGVAAGWPPSNRRTAS